MKPDPITPADKAALIKQGSIKLPAPTWDQLGQTWREPRLGALPVDTSPTAEPIGGEQ